MYRLTWACLLILGASFAASHGRAQAIAEKGTAVPRGTANSGKASEPLEIKLTRTKIVSSDGKESRQSADTVKPGEILEEVATYLNKSSSALSDLKATLPIPHNTELVAGSVKPDTAHASIDGETFSQMPLKRKVRQADGSEREQLVPLSEYKKLRWYPGTLPAASSLVFTARFKVLNDTVPPNLQRNGGQ